MSNFFKKLFGAVDKVHDNLFTQVDTSAEFDVEDKIKSDVRAAVQAAIDSCSKQYYRTIHVDFKVDVK